MLTIMKKLAIFAVLVAGAALAVPSLTLLTYQPAATAPSGVCDPRDAGISIAGAGSWHVVASADAGETFNGGGALTCYYCGAVKAPSFQSGSDGVRRWMRCLTDFDILPVAAAQDFPSKDFQTLVGAGNITYFPVAVGITLPDAGVQDGGFSITLESRQAGVP